MEDLKIISISDLIHRSLPLTGASSLNPHSSASSSSIPSETNPKLQRQPTSSASFNTLSDRNPSPRILTSLNQPTLIIGTISLPIEGTCSTLNSVSCGCFSFSDGSSRVCCDVLKLDVKFVGERIHVLSWNFIPFKCDGGLLEIIRWSFPDSTGAIRRCSNMEALLASASSSQEERFKAGSSVCGRLESISPVSVVPCTVQSRKSQINSIQNTTRPTNLSGFVAELMVCVCKLCNSSDSVRNLHQGKSCHSFNVPVTVYFSGSASSWHPLLSKLQGDVVCVIGLRKKLVFIGKEDSYLMFVTTEKAALHMPLSPLEGLPFGSAVIKGRGDLGAYTGIVTAIYMQGMVVELDEKVWVLLTDWLLARPHPMRVGALISLRNVHFVRPKFSWTKMLLLGVCYKTSINVQSFSPLESQCHIWPRAQSLLSKFIESLVFSARFWVLLTVSCFKNKFAGIFTEKEILGSKHKEGMAQMYASSCLPSCVFRPRHQVLLEFCKHDLCGCGNEPNYSHLKLVVPISNFISHCKAMWETMLSRMQNDYEIMGKNDLLSCDGMPYRRLIRRIISSEDLGVILMGILQISPSSGRLQLIDATGSIDVVVPDFPSNCNVSSVYEVRYYNVVLEGFPAKVDPLCLPKNESFSCKGIFHHVTPKGDTEPSIYIHFYLRDATCLNVCLRLPSCMDLGDNLKGIKDGRFHLLLLTHKFPAIQNSIPINSNKSKLFAEAIILPWDLFLPAEHEQIQVTGDSKGKLKEQFAYLCERNFQENLCNKKPKLALISSRSWTACLKDNLGVDCNGLSSYLSNCYSSPDREFGSGLESGNLASHIEWPCLAHIKSFNDQRTTRPGILLRATCNEVDVVGKKVGQKMLLEFKSDIFSNYQLLRVGEYYVMKYNEEGLLLSTKECNHVRFGKALITSQTPLWSLAFSCDEVLSFNELLQNHPLQIASIRNDVFPAESSHNRELFFQRSPSRSPETCSDINLHLSADVMNLLNVDIKALEDGSIKPFTIPGEAANISTCIGTMMAVTLQSSGIADRDCRLPRGNLVSFHGNVVDVHSLECNSVDIRALGSNKCFGDNHQLRFFQGLASGICIHVADDHQIVKLRGNVSKHAYPIGMGPGVNATFHRVLVVGQHELMLTPVSFIVINSLKEVDHEYSDRYSLPPFGSDIINDESLDTVSLSLISELIECFENKLMQFRCRVVAIHVLVLEKKANCKFEKPQSRELSMAPAINIPFAGFILDDGSSLCYCWASAERAATLLRLPEETLVKAFSSNNLTLKAGRPHKTPRTASYHLQYILKKHHRITMKNYGVMLDSSCQDLIFSVNSDNVFSDSDENLLKFIILNACCGSILNVVGSLMDSNANGLLEKKLAEMEMTTMDSMQNIWAREVQCVNPQMEARNIIQELIK